VEPVAKLKSVKARRKNMEPDMLRLKRFKAERGVKGYAHLASEKSSEAQSMQDFMSQMLGMLIENLSETTHARLRHSSYSRVERAVKRNLGRIVEQRGRNEYLSQSWALPTNIH
jgi:hypothetical protein